MADETLDRCFRLLELEPGATFVEVREAYRVQCRVWHPDRFAGNAAMHARATLRQQELNAAYRTLVQEYQGRSAAGGTAPSSGESQATPQEDAAAPAETGASTAVAARRRPGERRRRSPDRGGIRALAAAALAWAAVSTRRALLLGALLVSGAITAAAAVAVLVSDRALVRDPDGTPILVTALATGGGQVCGAGEPGVACWGRNDAGQSGIEPSSDGGWAAPAWHSLPTRASAVAAGLVHTCALLSDGRIECWGANFAGQLGTGGLQDRASPAAVLGDSRFASLSSLGRHTCALTRDGTLYCWGDDTDGQLGLGRPVAACQVDESRFYCSDRPERVAPPARWREVAAGGSHSCGIEENGGLSCWGSDRYGQLGAAADQRCEGSGGAAPCRRAPGPVSLPRVTGPIHGIAAGASHSCVLDGEGRPLCWGLNSRRQAGADNADVLAAPTPLRTDLRFTALFAGGYHTCGVTARRDLWCWGSDAAGELGGTGRDRCGGERCTARPVEVARSVSAVATGFGTTCAAATDGRVHCWGSGLVEAARPGEAAAVAVGSPGRPNPLTRQVLWRFRALRTLTHRILIDPLRRLF